MKKPTVDIPTKEYIKFHNNRTATYFVVIFLAILIPFIVARIYFHNELLIYIGAIVSLILSLFICMKFLNVSWNPKKDIKENHPRYVKWLERREK